VNKSCVAACLESVRMAVESVSGCSWNECPDQRGITVRMCVEWVSESAWNPHSERVMGVLDAINAKWGRNTLRPGRVPTEPDWGMRREMMSQSFTTRIDQLWVVQCK